MTEPIPYYPRSFTPPARLLDVPSAWRGIESALTAIFSDFRTLPGLCLELGVDYGYSTAALSNFFFNTIAVDTFQSDPQTGYRDSDQFERVAGLLADYPVTLIRMDARQWVAQSAEGRYACCHIDLYHDYDLTYLTAKWAVAHADLVLLHDTEAFAEVKKACADVAEESGYRFYNWSAHFGLGILSKDGLR